jgi:hypothetical protein
VAQRCAVAGEAAAQEGGGRPGAAAASPPLSAIRRACANLNDRHECRCATLDETCAVARLLASIPAARASDNLPVVP